MKLIRLKELDKVPASHESPENPGVLKSILISHHDRIEGKLQMVNWAYLEPGKSFERHYHEDMEEIFIIINGQACFSIETEDAVMEKGDTIIVPIKKIHQMKNIGSVTVEYVCIGISKGTGGKTVNI